MRYLALLLFFSVLFTSCEGDTSAATEAATMEATEAAQEKAYEAMMAAHDRVMPMMGKITAAQRSIKEELKTDGIADSRKEVLTAANEQLEDAGDKMMEWMADMKPLDKLREEMDNDGIMKYVKDQAASVAKVEMSMTAAIAAGKEIIGGDHGHDHGDHGHDHKH